MHSQLSKQPIKFARRLILKNFHHPEPYDFDGKDAEDAHLPVEINA